MKFPIYLNSLADCYAKLGNDAKAVEYLKQSLEMDPEQEAITSLLRELQRQQPPKK